MKRNYYDIVTDKAWKAHCKAEALKYLFSGFTFKGSAHRDKEAYAGIAYILEEISNESRIAYEMLSDVKRPPLDTEITDPDNYRDRYAKDKF